LEALNQVDADALTFETCSSGTGDLEAIGRTVTDKKVVIGVIGLIFGVHLNHHI